MNEEEKLARLCETVIHSSDSACEKILNDAKAESEAYTNAQGTLIEDECARIIAEAKKQAAEISEKLLQNTRIETERARLALISECVEKAKAIFEQKLEQFSDREDYPKILTALAIEAMKSLPRGQTIVLKLNERDAKFGDEVAAGAKIKFDATPADIAGGVALSTEDGRWNITSDWKAKTDEMTDEIATRVLAAL